MRSRSYSRPASRLMEVCSRAVMPRKLGFFRGAPMFMAGASLCFMPGAVHAAEATAPTTLFVQVCLQGGGSFARDRLTPIRASRLPWEPFELLRMAQRDQEIIPVYKRYYFNPNRDHPNTFYRVSGQPVTFLMVPLTTELRPGTTASQCAVLWRGKDFKAAQDAVEDWKATPRQSFNRARGVTGLGWVDFYYGGSAITAATFNGWTMLRSRPKLPISAE
jgi:hypothetical protein